MAGTRGMAPTCEVQNCEKPVNKDGVCFRHKLLSVGIAAVPGGSAAARTGMDYGRNMEKNLNRYERKKKAGDRPSGITDASAKRDEHKERIATRRPDLAGDLGFPELSKE